MATRNPKNPDEIQLELSHEEVWDDSSLVEAWDEALQEYKKYHSIAATGEDSEALMRAVEAGEAPPPPPPPPATIDPKEKMSDAPLSPEPKITVDPSEGDPQLVEEEAEPTPRYQDATPTPPEPAAFPFAAQHPSGPAGGFAIGGNDESMRSLMMSWYWAGYYTGLHEGQQKALQQQQQHHKKQE